jgi:hypothetical protein
VNSLSRIPPSLAELPPRRKTSLLLGLYEFLLRAVKSLAKKTSVRWLLFEYRGLELVILSKPFKTKELAEKARLKYPDRVTRKIGIGVARVGA